MQLVKSALVDRLADAAIAATSAVNGDAVDMANFEGVMFIAVIGTAATDNTLKAQGDSSSGMGSATDLEGTEVASDGTSTTLVVDVYKPTYRYLRPVVTRGTSTTLDSLIGIQYGPRTLPTDHSGDTDVTVEGHVSPGAGTA